MQLRHFAVNYDYRCPFARNAHEHVALALRGGAPWEVDFLPFSLTQTHVEEGGTPVWDDESRTSDLIAAEASLVVRETDPDHFMDLHLALFAARHDRGLDLRDENVIREVLEANSIDPDEVFEAIVRGWPREAFRKAHESAVTEHHVFGVPTFFVGGNAAFARIMTRPSGDPASSCSTIERVLDLLIEHPELNEVKHTTVER